MSKQVYQWKRFWCPRSGDIRLDWHGYLSDPESDWGKHENPNLVTLDKLADVPCLILLGEAGMGKTTAMELAHQAVYDKTQSSEDICFPLVRLGDYGSDTELCQAVFRKAEFQAWIQGTHKLHLFLDSLDEGLCSIEILTRILKRELENLPCERLYLRITCRLEWPSSLEEKFRQQWGEQNVHVYDIAPLCRNDVIEAAKKNGINPDAFLEAVENKCATPFAIKPISLGFLIDIYKADGELPSSQWRLYKEGCLKLCIEVNPDRLEAGFKGKLLERKRMTLSGRMAAIILFSNRSSIWQGIDLYKKTDKDVVLHTLVDAQDFDDSDIKDVFAFAKLFSRSENGDRIKFGHRAYAEFLAAWYLVEEAKLGLEEILSLIVDVDRVIPQLQETVKWLANAREDVFYAVLKTDPDVLLSSKVATASDENKEMLIAAILDSHGSENLPYRHEIVKVYGKFKHPTIAEQLKPYLLDTEKNTICRMVAIDIVKECGVTELQDQLAIIALDIQETDSLRLDAALAICKIGDNYTKSKLKPLALLKPKSDFEEKLKGCSLMAVWPNSIATNELFDTLWQPVSSVLGGHYQHFIAYDIGEHLQISDLPVALKWLEKQAVKLEGGSVVYDLHYPFSELSDSILLKSWQHLEDPDILKLFTNIALIQLRSWKSIIGSDHSNEELDFQEMLRNDEKRHCLVESIIGLIPESDFKPYLFTRNEQKIIFEHDFNWLVSKSYQISSPDVQKKWATLVRSIFNWDDPEKVKIVLESCENNTFLYAEFCNLLEPIELSSKEAADLRSWHLEDKQREEERMAKQNFVVTPPPQERIINALHQMDEDVNAWCGLCREMTLKLNSTHYPKPFVKILTASPGWEKAETETRLRILKAAKTYIEQAQLTEEIWLGTDSFPPSVLAGYQALALLCEADQGAFKSISSDRWRKWTPIILDYPQWNTTEASKDIRQALLLESYKHAPSEFRRVFSILVDAENKQSGSIYINKLARNCWDIELMQVILEKVQSPELTAASFGSLLEDLLIYNQPEAKAFAESIIAFPLPASEQEREKVITAARSLIMYSDDAGWPIIWPVIQQDPEFGRAVLESVSYIIKFQSTLEQRIPEDCIADLYIFLVNAYPQTESDTNTSETEDDPRKAYIIEPEDSVKMWKDYIPQRLQERGTPESCAALRKIINELPELKEKLQWRLLDAEALTRRNNWNPPAPEDLLQLILEQEPSNSKLLEELQKVANEPKIDKSINIAQGANVTGDLNTGDGENQNKLGAPPETTAINWSGWISILVAIIAILVGVFNPEINQQIKQWFNQSAPIKVEPQSKPPSK